MPKTDNPKKNITFKLPLLTIDQVRDLAQKCGMSQAEVITLAVDRMHQKEIERRDIAEGE